MVYNYRNTVGYTLFLSMANRQRLFYLKN